MGKITQKGIAILSEITDDGGAPVFERGICYAIDSAPTTGNEKFSGGAGCGSFYAYIAFSLLQPATSYHVRAYFITKLGTFYSSEEDFWIDP